MAKVHITVFSDFICPWCYLGKVRLARVKEQLSSEIDLEISLHPYILYPHIPKGGVPKADFAKKTKPGMGKSLREAAKEEGIPLNYKFIERIPNSLEAHRLVSLITNKKQQFDLAQKIFHGYFAEGNNIEDLDYLTELGSLVGVSFSTLNKFKNSHAGAAEVQNALKAAKENFVTVVPSIKFDNQLVMPGLQEAEVWRKYIRRAAKIQI